MKPTLIKLLLVSFLFIQGCSPSVDVTEDETNMQNEINKLENTISRLETELQQKESELEDYKEQLESCKKMLTIKERQLNLIETAILEHNNSPENMVNLWATGVKERNGAIQFITLASERRSKIFDKYIEYNWHTGVSSPWVENYVLTKKQNNDSDEVIYEVSFQMMTSTGDAGKTIVNVKLSQMNDQWYITELSSSIKLFYFNIK